MSLLSRTRLQPRVWLLFMLAAAFMLAPCAPASAEEGRAPGASPQDATKALVQRLRSKDPEVRLEAAQEALANDSELLTSPLLKLLGDKSPIVRVAAVEALGARMDKAGRKKAASSLAGRVDRLEKKMADRDELLATLEALRSLAQPGPIKGLIGGIKTDSDIEVVKARLMAVAAVPAREAVERLIQFLAKGRRGQLGPQRRAAVDALQYATGQRARGLGHDPDRWRAWWRDNEKDFDFEAVAAARAEAARAAAEKKERQEARREARKKGRKGEGKRGGKGKKKKDAGDGSSDA